MCSSTLLDDWGSERLSASQRRDLMEIIEERHGRSSTLDNEPAPGGCMARGERRSHLHAILDRVVRNAYRLTLNGPSMRKTQAARAAEAEAQSAVAITANARPANGAGNDRVAPPPDVTVRNRVDVTRLNRWTS
jgi:hypothetical protein